MKYILVYIDDEEIDYLQTSYVVFKDYENALKHKEELLRCLNIKEVTIFKVKNINSIESFYKEGK